MTGASRTVTVIQARMSSSRLPGKTLMDLGGTPVIDHVIHRVREATLADDLVVATSVIEPDCIDEVIAAFRQEPLVDYCSNSLRRTYPIGMDCEVFYRESLERAR